MNDASPQSDAPQDDVPHGVPTGRAMHIIYICAITAALVGLYFGIRYEPSTSASPQTHSKHTHPEASHGVQPATSYWDINSGNLGPNAEWHTAFDATGFNSSPSAQTPRTSLADPAQARLVRSSRRSYNGAPPTVPHAITPMNVTSCLACHSEGMRIGDVVANPIPHEPYANCTQCHVAQLAVSEDEAWWLSNSFEGTPLPETASRVYTGAPPAMPHGTSMRTNCMGCHGPLGSKPIRSNSHTNRSNCTQCHTSPGGSGQAPTGGESLPPFMTPDWEE